MRRQQQSGPPALPVALADCMGRLATDDKTCVTGAAYCEVEGAGCARFNGKYYADGYYNGRLRYKHEQHPDLYIRHGGKRFEGFGITAGRESTPGPWAYFCETSTHRSDLVDVPSDASWVTHGGEGAKEPAPRVTVKAMVEKGDGERTMSLHPNAWALSADMLWDGSPAPPRRDACVVIQGGTIAMVCAVQEAKALGLSIEHHEGCCLMPGLIDAHVHMEFSEHHRLHEQPPLSPEELRGAMAARAERMLRSGITAARDLGGRNFASLWLRDEIRAGRLLGPQLVCAGQPLTVPGGHCHQWGGAAANLEEAKAVIDRQVKNGTDWVKVMATGGMRTPGTNVELAQFSVSDLQAIVQRAASSARPVAAHAHGAAGVTAAVQAGCRTVEHCTWIAQAGQWGCVDEATVAEMARRRIAVAPTAHANWSRRPMGERNFQRMSAALRRLREAGVQLVASSDAGAIPGLPHDALAGGVQMLASMSGMDNLEALQAATSRCADVIGLGAQCGRISPGLCADLVVVQGDPMSDLSSLRKPCLVVARGCRVEPAVPPPPRPHPAATTNTSGSLLAAARDRASKIMHSRQ
eukprot:TRINITY_DN75930_c0_g1_i1.p1 TRINITY_DN75930_c0_g1~~TRINITY_DN75930_c0_g1_i1.p1  ORF type:complete len:580 (-),score=92.04 TRINITY_DN75930_c0_g1_i1:35-1774(-)